MVSMKAFHITHGKGNATDTVELFQSKMTIHTTCIRQRLIEVVICFNYLLHTESQISKRKDILL